MTSRAEGVADLWLVENDPDDKWVQTRAEGVADLWLRQNNQDKKWAPSLIPSIRLLIDELEIPDKIRDPRDVLRRINSQPNDYFNKDMKRVKFGKSSLRKPSKVIKRVLEQIKKDQGKVAGEAQIKEEAKQEAKPVTPKKAFKEAKQEREEGAKQEEIKQVVEESKQAEGVELHRPGYNYMGPGTNIISKITDLKNPIPVNELDWLALEHDFQYMSTDPNMRRVADIRFIKQVKILAGNGKLSPTDLKLAAGLIDVKMLLEDVSINPIENITRLFAGMPDESKYDDFGDVSEISRRMIARTIDAWENYLVANGDAVDKETGEMKKVTPKSAQEIEKYLAYARKLYKDTLLSIKQNRETGRGYTDLQLEGLLQENPAKKLGHFTKYGEEKEGVSDIYGSEVGDVIGVERPDPEPSAEPDPEPSAEPLIDIQTNEDGTVSIVPVTVPETVVAPAGVTERSTINFEADDNYQSFEGNKIRPSMAQAGGDSVGLTEEQDDVNEKRIQEELVLKNTEWSDRENALKINHAQQDWVRFNRANILATMNDTHDDAMARGIESIQFQPPTQRIVRLSFNNIKKAKRVKMKYKQGRKACVQSINMRKFGRRTGASDDPAEANGAKRLTHTIDQSHKSRSAFKPAFIKSPRFQPPLFRKATQVY